MTLLLAHTQNPTRALIPLADATSKVAAAYMAQPEHFRRESRLASQRAAVCTLWFAAMGDAARDPFVNTAAIRHCFARMADEALDNLAHKSALVVLDQVGSAHSIVWPVLAVLRGTSGLLLKGVTTRDEEHARIVSLFELAVSSEIDWYLSEDPIRVVGAHAQLTSLLRPVGMVVAGSTPSWVWNRVASARGVIGQVQSTREQGSGAIRVNGVHEARAWAGVMGDKAGVGSKLSQDGAEIVEVAGADEVDGSDGMPTVAGAAEVPETVDHTQATIADLNGTYTKFAAVFAEMSDEERQLCLVVWLRRAMQLQQARHEPGVRAVWRISRDDMTMHKDDVDEMAAAVVAGAEDPNEMCWMLDASGTGLVATPFWITTCVVLRLEAPPSAGTPTDIATVGAALEAQKWSVFVHEGFGGNFLGVQHGLVELAPLVQRAGRAPGYWRLAMIDTTVVDGVLADSAAGDEVEGQDGGQGAADKKRPWSATAPEALVQGSTGRVTDRVTNEASPVAVAGTVGSSKKQRRSGPGGGM